MRLLSGLQWFLKRFSWTVFENEDQWYYTDYFQGQGNYASSDKLTLFFQERGVSIRGHAVAWDDGNYVMPWIKVRPEADFSFLATVLAAMDCFFRR